ncbi:MAG: MBL fold metallo-hydrolase [Calditrichaeota bacterium]|nr:MAG: MBL fold metallo-hydrolase [Calditrichota bacterium]
MPNIEWKRMPVGPLAMNCYIFICRETDRGLIIDPGDDVENLWKTIQGLDFTLEHILMTHGHFDHILNLQKFQTLAGLKAKAHPDDKALFENVNAMASMYGLPSSGPAEVDFTLAEGQVIEFGKHKFEVFHTPGHSPGSVSFVGGGVAVVGDVLFRDSIGRTDLPGASFEQLINSIRSKLFVLNDETEVLSGHGETTTIGYEKKYNPFLR